MPSRRTTPRSWSGKKLYAVRDAKGRYHTGEILDRARDFGVLIN
jgi:hypothetical protein